MIRTDRRAQSLSPARLGQIVARVAASSGEWRDLVRFDPARRWYHRMELTGNCEVWLLSWLPGQQTGFHDHGCAYGAFAVADGELQERTAAAGLAAVSRRTLRAGGCRSFGRRHIHDVGNASARPAVSIHAYSPPLTAMRRYTMTPSGLIQAAVQTSGQDW